MKIRRIVAIVMTVAFMLCCAAMPVAAAAPAFNDADGHWAEKSIERWAGVNVLNGYPNGTFGPDDVMTRGQFAKVLAVTLGLDDALPADTFADLDEKAWDTKYILLCADAGIIKGVVSGTDLMAAANDPITREQAFAMVVRAFDLAPVTDAAAQAEIVKGFADEDSISNWALPEVAAIVKSGAVVGIASGNDMLIKAQDKITRAELVKILDRLIVAYVDENGKVSVSSEIGDADAAKYGKTGNIVVVNQNCTKDVVITTGVDENGKPVVNVAVEGVGDMSNIPVANGAAPVVVVEKASQVVEEKVIVDDRDDNDKAAFHKHEYVKEECKEPCEVAHKEYAKCECGDIQETAVPAKSHEFVDGVCKVCGKTTDDALKFALEVESDAKVTATVTDDYNAVIVVENGKVSSKSVALTAKMKDVGSLGLKEGEVRSHTVKIEDTGMTVENIELKKYLSNAWGKEGKGYKATTINVDVNGKPCTYVLEGSVDADGNAVIEANTNVEETRAAWQELTSHVESKSVDTTAEDYVKDDSKIVINQKSYVVIGGEKLQFEIEDDLVLDNFSNIGALKQNIKDHVQVVDTKDKGVVAFVGKDTALRVGDSIATLEDDCKITVTGLSEADEKELEGILSEIRTDASGSTTALVKALVEMINDVVGALEGDTIGIKIEFIK